MAALALSACSGTSANNSVASINANSDGGTNATKAACPATPPKVSQTGPAFTSPGDPVKTTTFCTYVGGKAQPSSTVIGLPIQQELMTATKVAPDRCAAVLVAPITLVVTFDSGVSETLVVTPDSCPRVWAPDGTSLWMTQAATAAIKKAVSK
jgi:hypothetical protein